jgi:acetyl esterase
MSLNSIERMKILAAIAILWLITSAVQGSEPEPPARLDGARAEVYKRVGDADLKVHIFEPPGAAHSNRAAIVFFFGGGWKSGSPKQFREHCRHFAARGMVAMAADYRVNSRHGVKAVSCVTDAKSCIRWVRANAARLGIDPERIVAAGGSAGGHIAAATATLPGFDEPDEPKNVSSAPNALVLFNPALVLAPMEGMPEEALMARLSEDRMGVDPAKLSPAHYVKPGLPPTIIFHGKADKTVPYATAEAFTSAMKRAGNRCELVGFEGQGHGFFNFSRGASGFYRQTLDGADAFLVTLGFLPPLKEAGMKLNDGSPLNLLTQKESRF